ncbi:LytR cell envelope-related transcriptional attenuator [Kribbella steppae]|uniref:LytR cell envelope-related transcriptional attenuator n=1 Tax=Kribbella steppae TaxID=2512223 RepID=A0A4V2S0P2_9ACTN|nr:LytR C-terminal domain-containing protein [Kribbella steppae]TCO33480.1 LytR cell envelope-related transcriptional attenuator [Kribbella steppae]
MPRPTDDRGQVLSSLVAVLAVVAIVAGLLVLFGTRGDDSTADEGAGTSTPSPKPTDAPSTVGASVPRPTAASTTPTPTAQPTSEPTAEPTTATPATQPPATQPPATQPTTIPPAQRPAVEIYNNTVRKGLADSVAGRARQAGWTVAGADNWRGKIAGSTVYYPPGMLAAANQLARDLGIGRTKGALDNMKKDRLTVILTSDYAG